jgi:hypothetical protein
MWVKLYASKSCYLEEEGRNCYTSRMYIHTHEGRLVPLFVSLSSGKRLTPSQAV